MVGRRTGAHAIRAPFLFVHLDPARPRTGAPGERRIAPVGRLGRYARNGAPAPVPATRPWRRTPPSLDGSARQLRTPERTNGLRNTNRPIGLEAGSSSGRFRGLA